MHEIAIACIHVCMLGWCSNGITVAFFVVGYGYLLHVVLSGVGIPCMHCIAVSILQSRFS